MAQHCRWRCWPPLRPYARFPSPAARDRVCSYSLAALRSRTARGRCRRVRNGPPQVAACSFSRLGMGTLRPCAARRWRSLSLSWFGATRKSTRRGAVDPRHSPWPFGSSAARRCALAVHGLLQRSDGRAASASLATDTLRTPPALPFGGCPTLGGPGPQPLSRGIPCCAVRTAALCPAPLGPHCVACGAAGRGCVSSLVASGLPLLSFLRCGCVPTPAAFRVGGVLWRGLAPAWSGFAARVARSRRMAVRTAMHQAFYPKAIRCASLKLARRGLPSGGSCGSRRAGWPAKAG